MKLRKTKTLLILVISVLCLGWVIPTGAIFYEYDALDRLKQAETSDEVLQYQYDAAGNILSQNRLPRTSGGQIFLSSSEESSSFGVLEGWNPYSTKGVSAEYTVVTADVYGTWGDTEKATVVESVYLPESIEENEEQYNAQLINASAVQPGGANVYQDVQVGDLSYEIQGWVKVNSLENAIAQVIVNYYDVNDQFLGHENILNVVEPAEWHPFQAPINQPIGSTKARVHLQVLFPDSGGGAALVEFSNALLQPIEAIGEQTDD